jgi:SEC-C motif-containing protein
MIDSNQICPCGSSQLFATCCEPVINGVRESETAEQLMRARYSAFAAGAMDFVVATTHSRTRAEVNLADITEWSRTSIWHGLEILETKDPGNGTAVVSFVARFTQQGQEQNHRERSEFEREDGKWRFVTGEQLKNPTVRYETPRAGRNDPCPCGSGKKFKKCCAA